MYFFSDERGLSLSDWILGTVALTVLFLLFIRVVGDILLNCNGTNGSRRRRRRSSRGRHSTKNRTLVKKVNTSPPVRGSPYTPIRGSPSHGVALGILVPPSRKRDANDKIRIEATYTPPGSEMSITIPLRVDHLNWVTLSSTHDDGIRISVEDPSSRPSTIERHFPVDITAYGHLASLGYGRDNIITLTPWHSIFRETEMTPFTVEIGAPPKPCEPWRFPPRFDLRIQLLQAIEEPSDRGHGDRRLVWVPVYTEYASVMWSSPSSPMYVPILLYLDRRISSSNENTLQLVVTEVHPDKEKKKKKSDDDDDEEEKDDDDDDDDDNGERMRITNKGKRHTYFATNDEPDDDDDDNDDDDGGGDRKPSERQSRFNLRLPDPTSGSSLRVRFQSCDGSTIFYPPL